MDFDDSNDFDPTLFADDYNVWEEEQVFQDGIAERRALEADAYPFEADRRWMEAEMHSIARAGRDEAAGYLVGGVVTWQH